MTLLHWFFKYKNNIKKKFNFEWNMWGREVCILNMFGWYSSRN